MRAVQDSVNPNSQAQTQASIDGLKGDLAQLRSDYTKELDAVKQSISDLSGKISGCTSKVNLGEISVQKGSTAADKK